jgi:hypothetical protein
MQDNEKSENLHKAEEQEKDEKSGKVNGGVARQTDQSELSQKEKANMLLTIIGLGLALCLGISALVPSKPPGELFKIRGDISSYIKLLDSAKTGDNGKILSSWKQEFDRYEIKLSDSAKVSVKEPGFKWLVSDTDAIYVIVKRKEENIFKRKGQRVEWLSVYRKAWPGTEIMRASLTVLFKLKNWLLLPTGMYLFMILLIMFYMISGRNGFYRLAFGATLSVTSTILVLGSWHAIRFLL